MNFSDEEDLEEADVDVEDSDSILNSAIRAQREMDAVRARKNTFTDTGEVKMFEKYIQSIFIVKNYNYTYVKYI